MPKPIVGVLGAGSPEANAKWIAAARQGLSEAGYIEGRNVAIEHRWAEGKCDRLPILVAASDIRPAGVLGIAN